MAANHESEAPARTLITGDIDDAQRTTLSGNTRSEATAANDRGVVESSLQLDHLQLLLKRPDERERALQRLMKQQVTAGSPEYHRWLTAQAFGERFGASPADLLRVTAWLAQKGFQVNQVNAGRTMIDFSGTADQVRYAFATEIHHLDVEGAAHIANVSDPKIPAALAPLVAGIVSLHDFRPHTNFKLRPDYTYTSGTTTLHALVPADLATIYNLNPLFSAGIKGAGQTIVLVEDTNVHATTDVSTFRSTFGLGTAPFTQVHPSGCTNPGAIAGNDGEATLDVEWAAAAAPAATLELASCKDTATTFGGLIAIQNLINAASPPAIMSISYGECEAENGAAANAAYVSTYQQAASEGVSIFVSSGDEGAASCDPNAAKATHGIGVSGFASTPYNVAVGGTDYSDTFAGTTGTYWNAANTATFGSAKSYIPEIPWNDSCASQLIATFNGFATTYGTGGFCNSTTGKADYLTTGSGSGGPSGCAIGTASTTGVVSGSCAGTAKPSWQAGFPGNPSDGVRDIPDVSLFAANGVWGHYFVYCYTGSASFGGAACTGAPSGWSGAGGTSFSAPILAAIQALVNQKTNSRTGNPNPVYYQLAAAQFGGAGAASCNSSNGNAAGGTCQFYDVTQGDLDVNCTGTHNCYRPSGVNGVLSTSNTAYSPAYGTGTGWDFSTGLGSINAANLVNGWPGAGANPDYALSAAPASVSENQGASATSTIAVAPQNGFTGSVALSASGLPTGVTASFSPASTTSSSTLTLTASATATTGTSTVLVTGTSGTLTHTTSLSLTVNTGSGTVQLLGNTGFEGGSSAPAPWTATAGVISNSASEPPHAGSWDAWMDGYGRAHTDTVAQSFTIPAGRTTATLAFFLHINSAETTTTTAFDTLKVQVLNGSGTVLATLATYSNLNAAAGYGLKSLVLTPYIGQTITLKFLGVEDASLQTSFVLDDVTVNVQ